MPVHGMNIGECPCNTAEAEPGCYLRIFVDVTRIIIIDEVVPERLAKNKPRQRRESEAKTGSKAPAVRRCLHFKGMSNDQCLMTKESRNPNDKKARSGFVI
jgi:hypothetical protein